MSYSFSRDRTAEIRASQDSYETPVRDDDRFGPSRIPAGYSSPTSRTNINPFERHPTNSSYERYTSSPIPPRHGVRDPIDRRDLSNDNYEMQTTHPTRSTTHPDTSQPADTSTMSGFFDEIERLKNEVVIVSSNVDEIDQLHNSSIASYNEQQLKTISEQLQRLKTQTQKLNLDIKNRIKTVETANAHFPNSSDAQIRRTQTMTLRKRFIDTIQRYQDLERSYEQKYLKPEATSEEVDQLIGSNETPQIFAQSIMQAGRRGQANAVLSEVQLRNDDIKNIEKTILELHQLFMDMAMMVEQQGEVLNQTEQHAENTTHDVETGHNHLIKAIKSARATRAKKWCCFVLFLILCVVIAILVWWFGFNHKGVGDNP
ncbi:t-SNARE [Phycomyces blakesleeanus]|uniref:t-SNARE n=1 Tax=Phycomyces blakesleeanus TaxID=4837 RepID=A0ABR3BBQ6_PHYBL